MFPCRSRLPCLWAAFKPGDAENITGDGPELAAYASRIRKPAKKLLAKIRREHFGLWLYPLAWVSHHWQQVVTVFADLEKFPQCQRFDLRHLPADLLGYDGAAEFNLWHNRFRQRRGQPQPHAVA